MNTNFDLNTKPLLTVEGVKKYFPLTKGFLRKDTGSLKAVNDVSFEVYPGETLGLVGESGCGKTTLGRCIMRGYNLTDGSVRLNIDGNEVDISRMNQSELKPMRKNFQMIFQDPYNSLNPRMTVYDIVGEPLKLIGNVSEKEREQIVKKTLEAVGLEIKHMKRYPHAFSGGQRQRIGIARALTTNPRLIICDEPVSALDVSVQAQILNLLEDLQETFQLTYLFIAHDLSVVEHISDRVAVMYVGKIVELAPTDDLYYKPLHPYTAALLSAVPQPDPTVQTNQIKLPGEVANPANLPSGCPFHPRCLYATDKCREETPMEREIGKGHFVSCHYAGELDLKGI
jgi:peptide/nickel transport system ATP-binding protein